MNLNSNLELDISFHSFHGTLTIPKLPPEKKKKTPSLTAPQSRHVYTHLRRRAGCQKCYQAYRGSGNLGDRHLQWLEGFPNPSSLDEGKTFRWNSLGRIYCKNPPLITATIALPEMGSRDKSLKPSGEILADVAAKRIFEEVTALVIDQVMPWP